MLQPRILWLLFADLYVGRNARARLAQLQHAQCFQQLRLIFQRNPSHRDEITEPFIQALEGGITVFVGLPACLGPLAGRLGFALFLLLRQVRGFHLLHQRLAFLQPLSGDGKLRQAGDDGRVRQRVRIELLGLRQPAGYRSVAASQA